MQLIGILGKGGAGKTTFANMLAENKNVGVIHMDYMFDDFKKKKIFSRFTRNVNYGGESTTAILKSNLSDRLYNTKLILPIYLKFRKILLNIALRKKIKECENDYSKVIVVEGGDLRNLAILKQFNYLIYLTAPYDERINRLAVRDGLDEERIKKDYDKSKKSTKGKLKKKIDFKIENDGDLQQLRKKAGEILKILIKDDDMTPEKSFRERNRLKDTNNITIIRQLKKEENRIENGNKEFYKD